MKIEKLENMTKGWFIGNFEPSLIKTNEVECAVKQYREGTYEEKHFHKIATEITVVVVGEIKMNDHLCIGGDIIILEPNEISEFLAVTDAVCAVVKFPGATDDKYIL